jgi:hypothetical protein
MYDKLQFVAETDKLKLVVHGGRFDKRDKRRYHEHLLGT